MMSAPRVWTVSTLLLIAMAGCGISQSGLEYAERAKRQVQQRQQEVLKSRQDLDAFLQSPQSEGYRSAAESEQWSGELAAAEAKVAEADELVTQQIQPIVEADSSSDEVLIYDYGNTVLELVAGAREQSEYWRERKQALDEAKANAPQLLAASQAALAGIENELSTLQPRAASAKKEFPEQAQAIDSMTAPLVARGVAAREALQEVEAQVQAHQSGSGADYGALASKAEYIEGSRQLLAQSAAAAEAKFAELSRSYSRTLTDMKAEYELQIRRQSWDNSVDYPSLHNYDYPRKVEGDTYEHFDSIPGSLATFKQGWFGDDLTLLAGVNQQQWESLKIDPELDWPPDDDEAEFWLESAKADYFHKYHVVESGELIQTDWIHVDEAFFFANIDNLGMDVEAKPYGLFEEQKLTHAAPPGMAYVGNERYGRWEQRNGGSVWTWVAPYLFYRSLFGSPWIYPRNEWNTWRTGYYGSRPYYGTGSSPSYGTRSSRTQTSPVLSGSQFGRSGGFNRPAGSVRGAGPASRGGGFGGSGK